MICLEFKLETNSKSKSDNMILILGIQQSCKAGAAIFRKSRSRPFWMEPESPFLDGAGVALFGWSRSCPFLMEAELPFFDGAEAAIFDGAGVALFEWNRRRPF